MKTPLPTLNSKGNLMSCRQKWINTCNPSLISLNPRKESKNTLKWHLKAMKLKRTILKHWQKSENSIPNLPIVGGIILKEKKKLSKASSNLYWSLQNPSLRQSSTSNGNHPNKLTFLLFYEIKSYKTSPQSWAILFHGTPRHCTMH